MQNEQQSQAVSLSPAAVVAVCIFGGLGVVAGIGGSIYAGVAKQEATRHTAHAEATFTATKEWREAILNLHEKYDEALRKKLLYDVVPVPSGLEAEYRRLNPLDPPLPVFVKAVIANPSYADYHGQIRRTETVCSSLYPDTPVFVRIRQMP